MFDPLLEAAAEFYNQLPVPPPEPEPQPTLDPEEIDIRVAWGILKPEEVLPPSALPEPEPEAISPEEAQRRAVQVRQNALLADTRARVFINTHYNDLQAALFDFATSASRRVAGLEDPSLNYLAMVSPLIGVVKGKVNDFFDEDAVLPKLGTEIANGATSFIYTKYSGSLTEDNANVMKKAGEMVETLAQEVGNRYSGAFLKRQKSFSTELADLIAGKGAPLKLLTDGGLDNLNQIVTEYLGVPDPDEESLYKQVRIELEGEFAAWLAYQQSTSRWIGVRQEEAQEARAEARSEASAAADRRNPKLEQ
jgi:hypothetical protein